MTPSPTVAHEPVMTAEVVTLLNPARGGLFVDCTVGGGGHARALLAAGADRVLGLDRDGEALPVAAETLRDWSGRVELAHADFRTLDATLTARGITEIDGGALADLGMSSLQLDGPGRGFSFRRDEPLDMRMDRSTGPTAADMLREADESDLADVIYRYGEDRHARRIRPWPRRVPGAPASHVHRATGRRRPQGGAAARPPADPPRHPDVPGATPLGQSGTRGPGRVAPRGLPPAAGPGPGWRSSLSHSLEDRIVKRTLRGLERGEDVAIRVLTKRPLRPAEAEVARNPRARSAKLRAAERVP